MQDKQFSFEIISGDYINDVISTSRRAIIKLISQTYLTHLLGKTENPDSYFLHFKNKPEARIIALPAAIDDPEIHVCVSGIKWIASYPLNIDKNLQRASAVIILNDYKTGYPFVCLEASQISAARTAASAVLAAQYLSTKGKKSKSLSIIGSGVIARTILTFFIDDGWCFDEILIYDLSEEHRINFFKSLNLKKTCSVRVVSNLEESLSADIVLFSTTATSPYVTGDFRFAPQQLILNISLRDLSPEIILNSNNVLDDIEHCMKANTSAHLAEQKYAHRDFINGTLSQVINNEITLDKRKATIFSPFGLGVLDLSLAMFIYHCNKESSGRYIIPNFFKNPERWSFK